MIDLESKKSFRIKPLIIIIVLLLIILAIVLSIRSITFKKIYEPPTALVEKLPRHMTIDLDNAGIMTDRDMDGVNDQKDILEGAKKQLEKPAKNIYTLEGSQTNYFSEGDPPAELAISTDIVARAFMNAGYDLRMIINKDIKSNFDDYPLRKIWNQSTTDLDIDYRRIQNMEVFFKRNADELSLYFHRQADDGDTEWLPGDVVFFDMSGDGLTDSVGILSDFLTRDGIPKVIYNYIRPGYTVEDDILETESVTGHYRYPQQQGE